MTRTGSKRWMAIALPVGAGGAVLALGLFLMPSTREVEQAGRRATAPVAATLAVPSSPAVPVASPSRAPTHPDLAAVLNTADAGTLAALTRTLAAATPPARATRRSAAAAAARTGTTRARRA